MQVNTDIYGNSDTWRRDEEGFSSSSNTPAALQFKRGQYDRLMDYVSHSKMAYGEHIDYSICYAAHGYGMPLASLRTWYIPYINGQYVVHTYKRDKVTGWFFGHQVTNWNSQSYMGYNPKAIFDEVAVNEYVQKDCWIPDGIAAAYPNQQSALIIPIVEFNTKGVYFGIRCRIFNPTTGSSQLKYLSELQTGDWSAWKIIAAWGVIYTCRDSESDFTGCYQWGSNLESICPAGTLEFTDVISGKKSLPFLKYCQYMRSNGNIPLFGWLEENASIENVGGTYHAMNRQSNANDDYNSYFPIFVDTVPNTVFNEINYTAWGKGIEGYCDINAANLESIRKAAAAYGLFFTEHDPESLATNANRWDSENMFCGLLDETGIGNGEYTRGAGNADNPVYSMGSSQNSNYNPDTPVDPNIYSDTTTFNTVDFKQAFTRRYILNATQVGQLAGELWDAMATKDPDELTSDFTIDEFLTNNPIDCVVSLKYFPCTFADVAPAVVYLGKYQTGIAATALGTSVRVIDFEPIQVWRHFDDFRDFEPYTQIQLYIPLCGVVDLPTAEVMGHYVSVKLAIDVTTGAATGYVIISKSGSGGICIATVQGNAAIDIPVSGLQSASIQEAVFDSISKYMQTSISTGSYTSGLFNSKPSKLGMLSQAAGSKLSVSGIARGTQSPLGALSTAASYVDALNPVKLQQQVASSVLDNQAAIYDLQHIQMPTRMIGSASPLLSTVIELQCRIIIYRPITDEGALTSYGDTVGYACLMSGVVGNFSGLTVGTIDVRGINASDEEKKAIASAFASGVYL